MPSSSAASTCSTASASIAFDVETAPNATCSILGERDFAIFITPEHAPPINPSPWYAFRYATSEADGISVRLNYGTYRHRYAPRLIRGDKTTRLEAEVAATRSSATIRLPAGGGIVAAGEVIGGARNAALLGRLTRLPAAVRFAIARSWDGRPVEAVRIGNPKAARLIILMGRQHPPEVTGAIAMESFLAELARLVEAGKTGSTVQFLVIPQVNPDGVARGHWRANRGGRDLNRDWGEFSQPETLGVKRWLDALPAGVKPIAMLDFHSTNRNLFYVQSETEADGREETFIADWLARSQPLVPGYPFVIERRDANPGRGTAKNWFHGTFDIPAFTYEVGDDTDRDVITRSATVLARTFLEAIDKL